MMENKYSKRKTCLFFFFLSFFNNNLKSFFCQLAVNPQSDGNVGSTYTHHLRVNIAFIVVPLPSEGEDLTVVEGFCLQTHKDL